MFSKLVRLLVRDKLKLSINSFYCLQILKKNKIKDRSNFFYTFFSFKSMLSKSIATINNVTSQIIMATKQRDITMATHRQSTNTQK